MPWRHRSSGPPGPADHPPASRSPWPPASESLWAPASQSPCPASRLPWPPASERPGRSPCAAARSSQPILHQRSGAAQGVHTRARSGPYGSDAVEDLRLVGKQGVRAYGGQPACGAMTARRDELGEDLLRATRGETKLLDQPGHVHDAAVHEEVELVVREVE